MSKWRLLFWSGVIIGIMVKILDHFIEGIPILIVIVFEIIAITLIFAGLITRKKQLKRRFIV